MKKIFCIVLIISILLTSCSIPDVECDFCGIDIVSSEAYTISDRWCCESCYSDAHTCDYCDKKFINTLHESNFDFCDSCIENGNVIYCDYCEQFFPQEYILLEPAVNDYLLWNICEDCFYDFVSEHCGTDYESTWGKLIKHNGGELVWDSLTDEQRELVNYPYLDPDEVFYTPNGKSYHSVAWCYTLSNSETILSCTYDEAKVKELNACSKCVWK